MGRIDQPANELEVDPSYQVGEALLRYQLVLFQLGRSTPKRHYYPISLGIHVNDLAILNLKALFYSLA